MNYQRIYDILIARARGRRLEVYTETHHILPRCMGGQDTPENLVELTPEEHYVAHQLLVKIYPGIAPLVAAVFMMSRRCSTNRGYGWLRRRYSEARTGVPLNLSPNERMRRAESMKGNKRTLGYKHTAEARQKIAEAVRGRKLSAEHIRAMSLVRMGHKVSAETRKKISDTKRARAERMKQANGIR